MKSRKSPRKKGFDYRTPGAYFITICTKDRKHYFGEIKDGEMRLNRLGRICSECLKEMENLRKNVHINEYVIMPNHVHMILILGKWNVNRNDKNIINHPRGVSIIRPEYGIGNYNSDMVRDGFLNRLYGGPTVGNIIKLFKGNVTKYAKKFSIPFAWQTRYHDAIIKNQNAYDRIKWYIINNPKNWKEDRFISKKLVPKSHAHHQIAVRSLHQIPKTCSMASEG